MTTNVPVPYTRAPDNAVGFAAEWLLDPAEIAQRIGGTDFVPQSLRNNPAAITAALLYGSEIGLGRMESLAKIAVINGRPTLAAEAMRALILHAGHDIYPEETTINRCTMAGRRRDSETIVRVTWTMEDARRANLAGKPPWRLYPRQMLLARASAELARALFPDAIGGLAATEELEDNPELGTTPNGPEPPEKKTTARRRRRTSITAPPAGDGGQEAEATPAAVMEQMNRESAAEAAPLPANEQAVIDEAQQRFDATEVAPEPPNEQPPPIPEPQQITDAQRRKLHAMFREKEIIDRQARLDYCSVILAREIPTSTDLTVDEASRVIDALEHYDRDDPSTWTAPDQF